MATLLACVASCNKPPAASHRKAAAAFPAAGPASSAAARTPSVGFSDDAWELRRSGEPRPGAARADRLYQLVGQQFFDGEKFFRVVPGSWRSLG